LLKLPAAPMKNKPVINCTMREPESESFFSNRNYPSTCASSGLSNILVRANDVVKLSDQPNILAQLERPTEKQCVEVLGHGHLGVVLLPSLEDSFEQMHLNFY